MDLQQARPLEHLHLLAGTCPMCDQVIPNDRLASVKARNAEHEREMQARIAKAAKDEQDRLKSQLEADKAQALAKLQSEFGARELAAREAERKATLAQVEAKMADSANAAAAAQEKTIELQKKLEANEAASAAKVASAREEASRQAEAALQPRLAAAAEAVKSAEGDRTELKRKLEASAAEAAAQVSMAREEAARQAQAALQPQLDAAAAAMKVADAEKAAALVARSTTEAQLVALKEQQNRLVAEAAQEARGALEKASRDALNAAEAKHFAESQKFRTQLAEMTRQLENKTAQELGEGAEVDLFESLRLAYPSDEITRVVKGAPGADIRHRVMHNGQLCGLILYDSKNHKAWRNDFVTKLRDDQLNDKADHAILSTIAFPQGARQLHVQDGVVLVNPARAVVIAGIVRHHMIRSHSLRLSNEGRQEKAIELYDFITSERFLGQMAKIQTSAEDLLELDAKEQTVHKLTWAKRGMLVHAVAKAEADLRVTIEAVVGTTESLDAALAEAHKADGDTATAG
jgi:hypothetical protein